MRHVRLKGLTLLLCLWISPATFAGKVDVTGGFFQFKGSNQRNDTSSSLSGFGSYHIGYRYPLWNYYEVDVGYSLLATKGFGGDLAFGFDLGVNYFFMTINSPLTAQSEGTSAFFQSLWSPFVGIAFHQRNFQSTASQYAGAGIKLGTEYSLNEKTGALGGIRFMSLGGPSQATATQVEAFLGVMLLF